MRKLKQFTALTLLGTMLCTVAPVFSADKPTALNQDKQVQEPYISQQMKQADVMLSQIDMARHALSIGLGQDAYNYISKAQGIARSLKTKSAELTVASTLRMNDQVYTYNNEYKDFLIPVVDDVFTSEAFDMKVKSDNDSKVSVTSDEIGRYQLFLDIRSVQTALQKAATVVQDGDLQAARVALNDIYLNAVEKSVAYENPVWIVHDNLMVARQMITDHNYDGARNLLKKAHNELKSFQNLDISSDERLLVKNMQADITGMRKNLDQQDPSMIDKIQNKLFGWMHDLKNMGEHAQHKS